MVVHTFSIHAHFYQPPRENNLIGKIQNERSASPYPNWNERILAECYRPNAELGNFEQISFNIGPTLFEWLQSHDPATSQKIIQQERMNVQRYGVGNAIAQPYHHTILPLCTYQDKVTQVYWGLVDFERRFGRTSQGIWLPETAVDNETMEILARFGIQFTILAPWQADREHLDTSQPYRVRLSNENSLTVFFFQSDLSALISFDPSVTINADEFARKLLQPAFMSSNGSKEKDQFILLASDGELYGHHQPLREYFLERLVDGATSSLNMKPSYPGLWLKDHSPQREVRILENTSWSCHHGIERWSGGCDCTAGDSTWKMYMRQAFDHLTRELDRLYVDICAPLVSDAWKLRDRYIYVMTGQMRLEELLDEMAVKDLSMQEQQRLSWMLEAERLRQQMYASCGWFFEDFDRIEPRNSVAYAASAVQLAELASGVNLGRSFAAMLKKVISERNGLSAQQVFEQYLEQARE